MGIEGYGTKLQYKVGENWVDVGGIVGVTGPDAEVDDIEISDNDAVERWVEFLPGMIKAGTVGLKLHYDKTETAAVYALLGVKNKDYKVLFSDGSSWTFVGYLKQLGHEAPHDDAVTQEATFKVSGKPVFDDGVA